MPCVTLIQVGSVSSQSAQIGVSRVSSGDYWGGSSIFSILLLSKLLGSNRGFQTLSPTDLPRPNFGGKFYAIMKFFI